MFLSYANRDSKIQNLDVSISSHHGRSERRRSSSTPHVFLPYAERYDEIDSHCQRYVETHDLPAFQAAVIAKAIRVASRETGRDLDGKYRRSLHASFLDKALKEEHEIFEDVNLDDDDDTPDLLEESDKDSSWEVDFLRDQVQRQQYELEFLRAAVKELVALPVKKEEKTSQVVKEARNPRNYEVSPQQKEEMRVVIERLPSLIEIPSRETGDDYSEPMSELQSPSVIVLGNRSIGKPPRPSPNNPNTESNPEESDPVTTLALQNKLNKLQTQTSYSVCIPKQSIDLSKHENPAFVKAMQTIFNSRTKQQKPSYTDMIIGEIQEKRARGMKFQLHFEKRGVVVEGVYSGSIKDGLPHGHGVLRFNNRDLYIGEFSKGNMHGEGTLLSRCDARLITLRGSFRNNEFVEQSLNGKSPSSNESAASAGAA